MSVSLLAEDFLHDLLIPVVGSGKVVAPAYQWLTSACARQWIIDRVLFTDAEIEAWNSEIISGGRRGDYSLIYGCMVDNVAILVLVAVHGANTECSMILNLDASAGVGGGADQGSSGLVNHKKMWFVRGADVRGAERQFARCLEMGWLEMMSDDIADVFGLTVDRTWTHIGWPRMGPKILLQTSNTSTYVSLATWAVGILLGIATLSRIW